MRDWKNAFAFLRRREVLVVTLLLLLQAAASFGLNRKENIPQIAPLALLPKNFAGWQLYQEGVIEEQVLKVLRADDTLTRHYTSSRYGVTANLFIAFFKTQRTGQAPHSPKNCLPGSGWAPLVNDTIQIDLPGDAAPARVNRYVVQNGLEKHLVVYWYQSHDRVIGDEYRAKVFLVLDSIRYNRSDTAIVRVTLPLVDNLEQSTKEAIDFIRAFYPTLKSHLPG